ncbi:MAG: MFS transporter, partial [Ignavibacteria bacterium]|nr:MFS transporter [Ignavibacteria bacterium]
MHKLFNYQPPVLKTFFATEMWERYGFYVVQSLLALYLALHFNWSDESVYTLVSAFTALTYLSPVMGGWVADHWLGQKKSIIVATFFLVIGYVALACMQSDAYLKLALAAVAVGTGLLKPNI